MRRHWFLQAIAAFAISTVAGAVALRAMFFCFAYLFSTGVSALELEGCELRGVGD